MRNISTIIQLKQLMSDTYIYAVIVFVVAIAIAILFSKLVPWQGGKDKSYITRRIGFTMIGLVAVLGFWFYNDISVASHIRSIGYVSMFKDCNIKCLGITTSGYLIGSLIIMLCFRHSKFGSILGKIKK